MAGGKVIPFPGRDNQVSLLALCRAVRIDVSPRREGERIYQVAESLSRSAFENAGIAVNDEMPPANLVFSASILQQENGLFACMFEATMPMVPHPYVIEHDSREAIAFTANLPIWRHEFGISANIPGPETFRLCEAAATSLADDILSAKRDDGQSAERS